VLATALAVVSFFALIKVLISSSRDSLMWQVNLVLLQVCFTGAIFTFLFTIFYLAHRGLGPLPRIEDVLDKVIAGDYKQRIGVREKDILFSFITKVNKVIETLDNKAKH
jgi:nitrate/nitrite-specific signal transduction histidine kinase